MFKEIKGGTKVIIQGPEMPYECWVPPIGYGGHADTGELAKVDVIKRSQNKAHQFWERPELPEDWNKLLQKEKSEREKRNDPEYSDTHLDEIRAREWHRRLYGVWFYNNGKATYITGLHYMLLTYWPFQGKYFDYREPNKEYYYVIQYCIEDPDSLGLVEVTKRKEGKTARAGLFIYEYISRTAAKHGGIQSKTDDDADEVFKKSIINPWRKLPEFFRPIYDRSQGDSPKKELRFFNTSQKGKNIIEEDEALESFIDFKAASADAYDGPELHRYVSDEAGKLKKVSITDRHDVVMFCSEVDGLYVGKQLYTTTVEEMENGGREFRELVERSKRLERDDNGRTKSGLYLYFLPANRTMFYDKYGVPDVKRGTEYHMNKRKSLINNPRALSSYIRKNPFTLDEAFRVDGENCHYNPELLNDRIDCLWQDNLITRGNFVWLNGEPDTKVIFEKSKVGRWEICWNFKENGESNKVTKKGMTYFPDNKLKFVMGCDPFSHNKTVDNRRSDGAALVLMKFDITDGSDYSNSFVCKYKARPESASIFYEDMLKTAVYYGCEILFENNKNNWDIYFKQRGYEGFLMKLDGYPDYGIPGNENTCRQLVEVTEEYINKNIDKVFYKDLITQWLEFDMANTTKFDVAMAAGYTLIADLRKVYKRQTGNLRPITDYIKKHKIA